MSQQRCAGTFHIPLPTLKNWEQGGRLPDAPAGTYPQAVARRPRMFREALKLG